MPIGITLTESERVGTPTFVSTKLEYLASVCRSSKRTYRSTVCRSVM